MKDNGIINLNVEVDADLLNKLMNIFSGDSEVVLRISKDEDCRASIEALQTFAKAFCKKSEQDILCYVVRDNFEVISRFLMQSSAEVVTIYCSKNSNNVYDMLQTDDDSFSLHKEWIQKKKCTYIITWVVNEDGIYLHYNSQIVTKGEVLAKI